MDVQVRLGQEFLELVVLGLQVAQLGRIGGLHAAKARASLVKSWLAKAALAADVLDGHTRFSLLEESDDLLVGKSCGFHIRHSPKLADFVPSIWCGSEGAGKLGIGHVHAAKLAAPEVITGLEKAVPAAKLGYRQSCFRFPQEANDLFFGKSLFHVQSPVYGIGLQAQLLLKSGGASKIIEHQVSKW